MVALVDAAVHHKVVQLGVGCDGECVAQGGHLLLKGGSVENGGQGHGELRKAPA